MIDSRSSESSSSASQAPITLSICIPAYREAASLAMILPSIMEAATALTPNFEVLIVDTQEPMDDTAEVCARHVRRSGGNSFGDAVRTIIQQARGPYMLCMDADGSHGASYFASMWAERERNEITIGSRYVAGGQTENPAVLILMSYVVNLTFRVAFSIKAKDVTNSFRLYHRDVLIPLRLESNDFDILEEILIKASIRDPQMRIGEVPVTFGRRKAGESKRKLVQFAFGYLKTLKRLRSFAAAARKENASA
jgi:dolichol-phosphate mannosyltransferase